MDLEELFNNIFFYIECVGIVAWSLCGTVVALKHHMDAVGIFFIVFSTIFGGGMIRDLCIGQIPPSVLIDHEFHIFLLISVIASAIFVILVNIRKIAHIIVEETNSPIVNFFDGLGMAIFCVGGVNVALNKGCSGLLLLTFCGGITGVGGGIMRDLFLNEVPMIFRKHIYALPAFIGSFLYALLCRYIPSLYVMLLIVTAITVVRVLAAKYKWNLPVMYHSVDNDG